MANRELPAPTDDLRVLSQITIQAAIDLHDVLRRVQDALPDLRITTSQMGIPNSDFMWSGGGCALDHGATGSFCEAYLEISEIGHVAPRFGDMAPNRLKVVLPSAHLDRKRHPLAPPWKINPPEWVKSRYESENPEAPKLKDYDLTREMARSSLRDMVDRCVALAAIAADPARRFPHDRIESLRRHLHGVATAAHMKVGEDLQLEASVAYASGPDGPLRILGFGGHMPVGRRDLMDDAELADWRAAFPPVMKVLCEPDGRSLAFAPAQYGWNGGAPIDALRAVAGVKDA